MGRSIGGKKAEDTQVPATWNWNEIRKCAHLLLDRMAASLGFFSPFLVAASIPPPLTHWDAPCFASSITLFPKEFIRS